MSDSPEGAPRVEEQPTLVSIPEMPAHLKAAGLKSVGAARIRQLAKEAGFPGPVYERGRLRLWDLAAVLRFFEDRTLRQGERTDLKAKTSQEDLPRDHRDSGRPAGA
ncbi:hypothetical protein [Streptomyces sp. H27-H5]|uniref:hypothetical protein n=1 Tax=Streptomyces sp. H27-H5 TaxID=2996460 RepID=UPI00226D63A6|nr:hypothetical protein [Streptomyces sp. H27-H5]MCY0957687.1 hypothetical protein [Streptomyces sp. H27-H5]